MDFKTKYETKYKGKSQSTKIMLNQTPLGSGSLRKRVLETIDIDIPSHIIDNLIIENNFNFDHIIRTINHIKRTRERLRETCENNQMAFSNSFIKYAARRKKYVFDDAYPMLEQFNQTFLEVKEYCDQHEIIIDQKSITNIMSNFRGNKIFTLQTIHALQK